MRAPLQFRITSPHRLQQMRLLPRSKEKFELRPAPPVPKGSMQPDALPPPPEAFERKFRPDGAAKTAQGTSLLAAVLPGHFPTKGEGTLDRRNVQRGHPIAA